MSKIKSILSGAGSIIDLSGRLPPLKKTTDAEALASDWRAIGDDMRTVLSDIDQSQTVQVAKKATDVASTAVAWVKWAAISFTVLVVVVVIDICVRIFV